MAAQTRQMPRIRGRLGRGAALIDGGATVFVKDFAEYPVFDRVWQECLAATNWRGSSRRAVHPALLVEVQAIAVRPVDAEPLA
jgi:hypothetical protein